MQLTDWFGRGKLHDRRLKQYVITSIANTSNEMNSTCFRLKR